MSDKTRYEVVREDKRTGRIYPVGHDYETNDYAEARNWATELNKGRSAIVRPLQVWRVRKTISRLD